MTSESIIIIFDPVENKFIGIDQSSGGYPYHTKSIFECYRFPSIERAVDYQRTMMGKNRHPYLNSNKWIVRDLQVHFHINTEIKNEDD